MFTAKTIGIAVAAFISLFFTACCRSEKAEIVTVKGALDKCTTEKTKLTDDLSRLYQRVDDMSTEMARIRETPDGLYGSADVNIEKGEIGEAFDKLTRLVERFPDNSMVPTAKKKLADLKEEIFSVKVERCRKKLDSSKRGSYDEALQDVNDLLNGCPRCKSAADARKLKSEVQETLKNWPIDIDDLGTMKLRYADFKGKRTRLGKVVIEPSTYFNCNYSYEGAWRSFEIYDETAKMNVYCSRKEQKCEKTYDLLVKAKKPLATQSIVLAYPSYNDVCKEAQATLVDLK